MKELDLWGGDFYADGLFPIFTQMGPQLTKLNLVKLILNINLVDFMELFQVHVEELDNQALIILSQNTPNLRLWKMKIGKKQTWQTFDQDSLS